MVLAWITMPRDDFSAAIKIAKEKNVVSSNKTEVKIDAASGQKIGNENRKRTE